MRLQQLSIAAVNLRRSNSLAGFRIIVGILFKKSHNTIRSRTVYFYQKKLHKEDEETK